MAKPKKKATKPKKSEKRQPQGYEMKAKITDQPTNWVRLAMTDRNNIGVEVYGLVKVMRGDVVGMAEVHQQARELVGKRIVSLSSQIAQSLSVTDGKKVVLQRPTNDETEQYRENIAEEQERQANERERIAVQQAEEVA